ncbi:MAG: hypothetical protein J5777_06205 [Clostridiales bacterium]|nr:hypothetical protein [Clostridiales bacterium]
MAKSTKKKSGKSKAKLTLGITIAIMAVFALGYFVYFAGILPQVLPGMTITETKDGVSTKICDLSVLETNYYYMSIYSMYAQYGIMNADNLDTVVNSTTGQTYRELLLSQGADEAMSLILMEREADSKGFRELSQAGRCAKLELESLRGISKLYNYPTVDKYIAAQYGTGMTSRLYKKLIQRSLYTEEYTQYISQFDKNINPSDEDINKAYQADPNAFEKANFNYYLVTATGSDGKADIEQSKKDAQWIGDKSTDAKSFREAVMLYLKGKGDTATLTAYENDEDPTAVNGLSKETVKSTYDEKLADFLFADGRKEGDKTVIETATGAYVVIFNGKTLDEEKQVTYRTLTLQNDSKNGKSRTDEEVAADAKALEEKAKQLAPEGMDPLSFYKLVKANTNDQDEMMSGGYVSGETKSEMLTTSDGKDASAETQALAEWLFAAERKQGDVKIVVSSDNKEVTIYYFERSAPAWMGDYRETKITENVNALKESLKSTNPQYVINSDLCKKFIYG